MRSPRTTRKTRVTSTSSSRTRKTRFQSRSRWRNRLRTSDRPRTEVELEHLPEEFEHPPHAVEVELGLSKRGRLMRIASGVISLIFVAAAAWWISKQQIPTLPKNT